MSSNKMMAEEKTELISPDNPGENEARPPGEGAEIPSTDSGAQMEELNTM